MLDEFDEPDEEEDDEDEDDDDDLEEDDEEDLLRLRFRFVFSRPVLLDLFLSSVLELELELDTLDSAFVDMAAAASLASLSSINTDTSAAERRARRIFIRSYLSQSSVSQRSWETFCSPQCTTFITTALKPTSVRQLAQQRRDDPLKALTNVKDGTRFVPVRAVFSL